MNYYSRLSLPDNTYTASQRVMLYGTLAGVAHTPAQWYQMLHGYYLNNGLYDVIQQVSYANAIWTPMMKGFRNPAHRAVEFYVAKLWPGTLPDALPIKTENEKIVAPIQQVWKWSNFGSSKQVSARWVSEYGDWFCKVATNAQTMGGATVPATRVYFQNIKPEYVTDFETDERGFISFIQVEIQKKKKVNGLTVNYLHVETWSDEAQLYRRYELQVGQSIDNTKPVEEIPLSDFGIDFAPFVHARFQDIGEKRGIGCFVHVLDKVDEANRMATRLHQILFRYNKAIMAVSANGNDKDGRPLPPPMIGSGDDEVELPEDDELFTLPGMASLSAMVPAVDYDSYINEIAAQMDEIKQDLPEIKYFQLDSSSQLSGKAIRLLLGDAVDKVIECRGNMESALARADAMALTMGKYANLKGFADIGDFDNGDYEHTFEERDVIAGGPVEKAEQDLLFWQGWASIAGGEIPFETYARSAGWTDKQLADFGTQKAAAILTAQEDKIPQDGL
jgi:hypothetical protein